MYACIDLGSNSFHLLIGEWVDGEIVIVERCSEKVQLGEGLNATGAISDAAFERGLACLRQFKTLLGKHQIKQYWALGTNSFRNASNASEFIYAAKQEGIKISIVSGVQEAVLVYAGVLSSQPVLDEKLLVIDIGGGSTEVIVGRNQRRLFTDSLQIGSVSWRDRFITPADKTVGAMAAAMDEAAQAAELVFSLSAPVVKRLFHRKAYASSGTSKMLTAVCHNAGGSSGIISREILEAVKTQIINDILNAVDIPGVKDKRRDLLLGGWGIMIGLMRAYSIDEVSFSTTALREGMLDFMVKNKKTLGVMKDSNLPAVSNA